MEARIQEALVSPVPLFAGEWGERRVGEERAYENDFDGSTSEDEDFDFEDEDFDSEDEEGGAADGEDEQGKQEGNAHEEPASGKHPPRRAPGRRLVPAVGL